MQGGKLCATQSNLGSWTEALMPKSSRLSTLLALSSVSAAAVAAYTFFVRPWHLRWGATPEEADSWLPGDDLTPNPKLCATHAVTIHAPASEVWAWLVQIGQGRGGFYSYTWIENLLGLDIRNAQRVRPDLQRLHAADAIPLSPDGSAALPVDIVQPGRTLVLHGESLRPKGVAVLHAGTYSNLTWSFHLRPINDQTTRLIERLRADWPDDWRRTLLIRAYLEPGTFIMQRRMLLGIKERAERAWAERQRSDTHTPTLLDTVLPDYEFRDTVEEVIHASPKAIFSAMREAALAEKPLAQALAELRQLPARLAGVANGHDSRLDPFIAIMLSGPQHNTVLAEEPEREIVFGAIGALHDWFDQRLVQPLTLEEFIAFNQPNYEKLAISLRIEPGASPGRHRLVLEHRTHALDAESGRRFAAYWLGARPMGMLVAREFLNTIKQRAESSTKS